MTKVYFSRDVAFQIDDTFAATVHARTSYKASELVWDGRFTNIFNAPDDDGVLSMDISRLDEIQAVG